MLTSLATYIFSIATFSRAETFGAARYATFYGLINVAVSAGSIVFNVLAAQLFLAHAVPTTGPGGAVQNVCFGIDCFAVTFWISAFFCLSVAVPTSLVLCRLSAPEPVTSSRCCARASGAAHAFVQVSVTSEQDDAHSPDHAEVADSNSAEPLPGCVEVEIVPLPVRIPAAQWHPPRRQ